MVRGGGGGGGGGLGGGDLVVPPNLDMSDHVFHEHAPL